MARERLAAISIDLDTLVHYHAIHGLPGAPAPSPGGEPDPIYGACVPRFAELFAAAGAPATFFAIGVDLLNGASARALRGLAAAGHEIGNHSLRHLYDLCELDEITVRGEVAGGHEAIEAAVGAAHAPRGFRAPGYNLSPAILAAVEAQGYRWDSSIFPCPPYYLLKWSVMAGMALRGRETRAVRGDPLQLFAPRTPYNPMRGSVWRRAPAADGALLEIPIAVLPGARGPFIGTTLALAGRSGARALTAWMARAELVNLELHGIDVLDTDDGLEALKPHQPDVRITKQRKLETLSAVVEVLRNAGYGFVRLDEAARVFA